MKLIAHRGCSYNLPENTLAAFKAAKAAGFTSFEMDAQITKDDVLVVCHDYNLERTTKIILDIADLKFSELQKFNVAKYFKDYDGNLPVPSLEEVCNTLGEGVEIHLEIKNRDNIYPDIHRKIAEFIERRKTFSQSFLVSSFHHETLKKIKNLDTGISIGALFRRGEVKDAVKTALSLKAASINIHFSDAGKKLVNEAHKKGLKVLAYTVNDKKTAKRMKLLGIDGIFTDQTDLISIKK